MSDLFIQGSKFSPTIHFKTNGELSIEGKALIEDSRNLFTNVFTWMEELEVPEIIFDVNLEYFNTAVSKQLYELFAKIDQNEHAENIHVNWHYEEGDEDSFESGMLYHEKFPKMKFEFLVHAEII